MLKKPWSYDHETPKHTSSTPNRCASAPLVPILWGQAAALQWPGKKHSSIQLVYSVQPPNSTENLGLYIYTHNIYIYMDFLFFAMRIRSYFTKIKNLWVHVHCFWLDDSQAKLPNELKKRNIFKSGWK